MSLLQTITSEASDAVTVVDRPEDLAAIRSSGCAAAFWQRAPMPGFQPWIDGLQPRQLPAGRMILPAPDVRAAVTALCDAAGTPQGPERRWLIDDITAQAGILAGLTGAPLLRLRLDIVTTDACRKFHVDAVTARLICTYRGTGTQFGVSAGGAEPDLVRTAPTGATIILRGTLWPNTPPSALRHRSPPIAGTGETRLMLVLDPVEEPENDL